MTQTTTLASGTKVMAIATMGTEAIGAVWDLRWMLVLVIALILADFWFGISESRYREVDFRFSRAGRRTCNKTVDYLTYLVVGVLLGLAVLEPLGICSHVTSAAVGLGLGCLFEVDSIVGHVCVLHGRAKPDVWAFFRRLLVSLTKRKSADLGEALEESMDKTDNKEETE